MMILPHTLRAVKHFALRGFEFFQLPSRINAHRAASTPSGEITLRARSADASRWTAIMFSQ
jgi:hypothetical protein